MLNNPTGIFVDDNPTLYIADSGNNRIQLFQLGNLNGKTVAGSDAPETIILNNPTHVTLDTDGYLFIVDSGNNRIVGSGPNGFRCLVGCSSTSGSPSNQLNAPYSMAFDSYGNIYVTDTGNNCVKNFRLATNSCKSITNILQTGTSSIMTSVGNLSSMSYQQVVAKSLDDASNALKLIAGTGCSGSAMNMLNYSQGIFVDVNFNLYIADSGNNRIQLFRSDQLNGTTLAGSGAPETIILNNPTDVVLDVDGYLFIVDSNNNRIVGSGSNGFRCIVGCSNTFGVALNQLYIPHSMAFDSYGNIYVTDAGNNRLQKFSLSPTSCNTVITEAMSTTLSQTSTQILQTQSTTIEQQSSMRTSVETSLSTNTTTSMIITSSINNTTTTTTSPISSNQSCFSPIITLSPSNSSLTSPLQYRQSEDFSISSYIQLNCNSSLSIITKWIISTCISTCSFPSYLGQTIKTHLSEIFIPARTFNYGIYKLTLTVTMSIASYLTSSISAYVKIILSNLTVNIIQFGTSMITQGYQQDLILDPEKYSINPDTNTFNARNFLTIDDSRIDLNNPSCLSNQSNNGTKSSLIIFSNSLKSNEIYQFKVSMKNLQNSSTQAIEILQTSTSEITNNPIVQILNSGNQNAISQIISSLSQEFNEINFETIENVIANGIPMSNIVSSVSYNVSALIEYNRQINIYANARDYLITFTTNIVVTNVNSIKLQASSLAQLTQSTNQITRTDSMLASEKCYQLAFALSSLATKVPYEDVQIAATQIA
ncbi:unnamed protein product [Rotaria sp. Silwood1]|nr:unnamed protein product [Rotaria sp. Silwood1]